MVCVEKQQRPGSGSDDEGLLNAICATFFRSMSLLSFSRPARVAQADIGNNAAPLMSISLIWVRRKEERSSGSNKALECAP